MFTPGAGALGPVLPAASGSPILFIPVARAATRYPALIRILARSRPGSPGYICRDDAVSRPVPVDRMGFDTVRYLPAAERNRDWV